jgi:hypothetical protein
MAPPLAPVGQSGGSFLPNQPVYFSSPTPTTFAAPPNAPGLGDLNGLARLLVNAVAKPLSNAAPVSLFTVARSPNSWESGLIFYTVQVTDGTNWQTLTGMVSYAMVDVAGVGTFTITEVAANQAKAVTGASTLTLAWTFVTGPGIGTVKVQTTSSLVPTINQMFYTVLPLAGVCAIQ